MDSVDRPVGARETGHGKLGKVVPLCDGGGGGGGGGAAATWTGFSGVALPFLCAVVFLKNAFISGVRKKTLGWNLGRGTKGHLLSHSDTGVIPEPISSTSTRSRPRGCLTTAFPEGASFTTAYSVGMRGGASTNEWVEYFPQLKDKPQALSTVVVALFRGLESAEAAVDWARIAAQQATRVPDRAPDGLTFLQVTSYLVVTEDALGVQVPMKAFFKNTTAHKKDQCK